MSIENLKKMLESERVELSKKYRDEAFKANPNGYSVTPGCNEPDTDFELGHEAATNRLLPLLQKAVEMAEFYGDKYNWEDKEESYKFSAIEANDLELDSYDRNRYGGKKAREFLAEFTKITEIKKEGE